MRVRRFTIARAGGLVLQADPLWFLVGPLLLWMTAETVLPTLAPELSRRAYWSGAGAIFLAFALSLMVRALVQAVVGRRLGLRPKVVALHPGGSTFDVSAGVSVKAAVLMAGAGTLASIGIGALFAGLFLSGVAAGVPLILIAAAFCMAGLNWLVAVAALIPAYPLEGGQVLRLWLRRRGASK
jgi:Zn-dependent protease